MRYREVLFGRDVPSAVQVVLVGGRKTQVNTNYYALELSKLKYILDETAIKSLKPQIDSP